MNTLLDELRSLPLFRALPDPQLRELLDHSLSFALQRNQVLFNMGEPANRFFYLRSGQIKISRSSPQGVEKILAIVQPGQMFAEAAMFLQHADYPATASALRDSEVLGFESLVLTGYLRKSPELSMEMLGNLSAKLHAQINEIDSLTLQNATFRVLNYLNSLVGDKIRGELQVEFPAPKHTIASRLSITPETFSRSLAELNEQGIIQSGGKSSLVTIPDLEKFKQCLLSC